MFQFRPLLALSGAAVTVVVTLGVTAGPAAAAGDNYVALGDSYSSGVGAGDYTSDSGSCDRSPNAYSALWAGVNAPSSYVSVACSGATTADVNANQLSALSAATSLVSITIGGNDVGFSDIMQTCVLDGTDDCVAAVQAAEDKAQSSLPAALDSTYSGISADAPNARVVVLDYPVFYDLNQSGCIGLSAESRAKIDEGINLVDDIIANEAGNYGFTFADVRNAFAGHQICDDDSWLHSLNFADISESYHPTADGHSGAYYPVFASAAG